MDEDQILQSIVVTRSRYSNGSKYRYIWFKNNYRYKTELANVPEFSGIQYDSIELHSRFI
jgi:hypothetical protein